ncbi:zinc-finger-containing protein [Cupriavidus metallidurans]|uniref:zinc-finger-containing protein n=1 Tax=Cupriavidus metallidurans TaxID=119219 RepID=UPI001CC91E53|nr:zinc-finger-containing protein [Cupriavidus metallidurans]UBM12799.1 DUF3268 family zinc-finger domain-containing protein [Cupriavidus metallidurans]
MRETTLPFTQSHSAIARVKNPLSAPTECPHCGSAVRIGHHKEIYGKEYGKWPWVYVCTKCDSYVGMHPFTAIPLGTLANSELRAARNVAKAPFEMLWRPNTGKRSAAYAALAAHLGIPVEQCHFGWFDVQMCARAHEWAKAELARRSASIGVGQGAV